MILLTFILVIVTSIYVVITFEILKANKETVKIMASQLEASTRPYISIKTFTINNSNDIFLNIANVGKSAAKRLKLQIDKDFYRYGKKEEWNLKELNIFKNTTEQFQPGTKLIYPLVDALVLFSNKIDVSRTPAQFTITAEYEYFGNIFIEETKIDLSQHHETAFDYDPLIISLNKIARLLEEKGINNIA